MRSCVIVGKVTRLPTVAQDGSFCSVLSHNWSKVANIFIKTIMGIFVTYSHTASSCQVLYDLTIKICEEKKSRPQTLVPVVFRHVVC